jgi:rhamnose transport system ATP-binding protein
VNVVLAPGAVLSSATDVGVGRWIAANAGAVAREIVAPSPPDVELRAGLVGVASEPDGSSELVAPAVHWNADAIRALMPWLRPRRRRSGASIGLGDRLGTASPGDVEGAAIAGLANVSKSYEGVHAVVEVSIDVYAGRVHALVGENGAGKSTLVGMLGGSVHPDGGSVILGGSPVHFRRERDSMEAGIAVVHQEPACLLDLSVAENVCLGRLPTGRLGVVDWGAAHRKAAATLGQLGHSIDPRLAMRGLSIADQQLVEIARALQGDAKVIVLDEPTAALSSVEVERLSAVIGRLRERGVAIVFITHRLEEVFALADEVTVLRDGRAIRHGPTSDFTRSTLITAMVGRDLDALFPKTASAPGDIVLEVAGLGDGDRFEDVSFEVRAGEVFGIAGLVGSGRSEVLACISGSRPIRHGRVRLAGQPIELRHPQAALAAGVALVPEDRRQEGLITDWELQRNVSLPVLASLSRWGLLRRGQERAYAAGQAVALEVQATRVGVPVVHLSGGNQQKVVLAKWLGAKPRVLLLDEPTRGIDVKTKAEVYRIIDGLAASGMAIVLVSSELPELLAMADRLIVLHEGRQLRHLSRDEFSEEAVMTIALGDVA